MTGADGAGGVSERRQGRTVRRSVVALITTSLIVFALVASAAMLVARHVARGEALDESIRTARVLSEVAFVPELAAVVAGDPAAAARLDAEVEHRRGDGAIVRVKVWRADGTVVYSDDHSAINHRYPLDEDVRDAISEQESSASISSLDDPENVTELGISDRLVSVYIPLRLDDGTRLAFELYSSTTSVTAAEKRMTELLVPFALAAALLLLLAQLPLSLWLIRRVGRAQDERRTLLQHSLTASDRERRSIAADLHDGVVQDLAGASYVLGALSRSLPADTTPRTHKMLDSAGSAVQSSIASLRTLMVDIYPPDLTGDGLPAAIDDLAVKLQSATDAHVTTDIRLHVGLTTAVAAAVYRCARECLDNVRKHAKAHHVSVLLTADPTGLHMLIVDDGVGLPATVLSRTDGHLGMQLMQDAAKDLGGQLHVWSDAATGTTVTLVLPSTAVEEGDRAASLAAGRPLRTSAV